MYHNSQEENPLRFVIIPIVNITRIIMDNVINMHYIGIRRSVDGTKGILKYRGVRLDCLAGYMDYTREEILQLLATEEWGFLTEE